MIKIMLVDDQASARQSLRMFLALEPDVTVVGEAENGTEALALVPLLDPDVVIMDVRMPDMDGVSATAELRTLAPRTVVVILSLYDDATTRTRARAAGATVFIGKHEAGKSLCAAIRRAAVLN